MTSGTFAPGVYCAPSAALAGQMVLDAGGDSTGSFVFRIEGAMKSAENFQMNLENGARPGNVFFVADTASLGAYGSVIGSVITRGAVEVGAGTSVKGRVASKEGEVVLGDASNVALADAYIQICKRAFARWCCDHRPDRVRSYYLQFGSRGQSVQPSLQDLSVPDQWRSDYEVPTGSCSNPILVTDGNNTVTELIDGFYTNVPIVRHRVEHGSTVSVW